MLSLISQTRSIFVLSCKRRTKGESLPIIKALLLNRIWLNRIIFSSSLAAAVLDAKDKRAATEAAGLKKFLPRENLLEICGGIREREKVRERPPRHFVQNILECSSLFLLHFT